MPGWRVRGVTRDVLAIVAGMSIQDVRERPEERREEADRLHARFTDPTSDFLTLLNLWNHLQDQQRALAMQGITWRAAVRRLLQGGKTLHLKEINSQLEAFAATRANNHWEAKIRQVVQDERYFERVAPGTYRL